MTTTQTNAVASNAKVRRAPKPAAKPERLEGVGTYIKAKINDGKTNEEVMKLARRKFGIGDEKKHYASWYRCQMRRSGELSKAAKKLDLN